MYSDETLNCVDCNASFTFTSGEQEFFAVKGFTNKPNRCPDCRTVRKAQRGQGGYSRGGSVGHQREMFTATCSQCRGIAQFPFQPRDDRPVYCHDCFAARQPAYR
jgi:CxxC-x17-CxxC domain-containing protein